MANEVNLLITATDAASNTLKGIGNALGGIGVAAAAAAATGIAAMGAMMVKGITSAQNWAEQLDTTMDVLGTTAEQSAALNLAIKGVGGSTENITTQMAVFARGLETAKGKLGNTGLELEKLGINVYDTNGDLLDTTKILSKVADKLGEIPDGLEKTTALTKLFGRSGKDLQDVMEALANDGLTKAADKAKAFGLALSDHDVKVTIEFNRKLIELQQIFDGLWVQLGNQLIPTLLEVAKWFSEVALQYTPQIIAAIQTLGAEFYKVASWIFNVGIPYIVSGFQYLGAEVKKFADWFTDTAMPYILNAFTNPENLGNAITNMLGKLKGYVGSAQAIKASAEIGDKIGRGIAKGIRSFFETSLNPTTQTIVTQLKTSIMAVDSKIRDIGIYIAYSLVTGFIEEITGAAISEQTRQAIIRGVRMAVDLGRMDFVNLGRDIGNNIAQGIRDLVSGAAPGAFQGYGAPAAPAPARVQQYTNPYGTRLLHSAGADFTVPSNYTNDTFPLGFATAGEHVSITPAGQSRGAINVYLNYNPVVSLMDKAEAETRLVPYVQAAIRQMR